MSVVYINGDLVPSASACLSVDDVGLLHGDGLFETMLVRGGRIHMLRRHLERLRASAALIELDAPSDDDIIDALRGTIAANDKANCIARVTVTRGPGVGESGSSAPTTIVALRPLLHNLNSHELRSIVILATRYSSPVTAVRIKSLSRLTYVLGAREALRRGADEGVFLAADGSVTEGTVSNVFIVRAGELLTAPVAAGVLPGIARGRVIELALQSGIPFRESIFHADTLRAADECFYTNAARGVVPVGTIDGHRLRADPDVALVLRAQYDDEIASEML